MSNERYFVLLTSDKECQRASCYNIAQCILIGPENEFLGFFCSKHGTQFQETLESSFLFKRDNYQPVKQTKKRKTIDEDKRRIEKNCINCKKDFITHLSKRLFCSSKCRYDYWAIVNRPKNV